MEINKISKDVVEIGNSWLPVDLPGLWRSGNTCPERKSCRIQFISRERLGFSCEGKVSEGEIELELGVLNKFVVRIANVQFLEPMALWQAQVLADDQHVVVDLMNWLRKSQHIDICAHQDVEASDRYTGFSAVALLPKALPELNWQDLQLQTALLGQNFAAPLLITGMTGGLEQGAQINLSLARAASALGIPMGVGSQRIALENSKFAKIFDVKKSVPNVFLIGNIGMAQLLERRAFDSCRRAVEMIGADALAIHLNVIQELVQVEGDREFQGIVRQIGRIVDQLDTPVVVKEVGSGMDVETAKILFSLGIHALDIGGRGGTSWGYIEGLRGDERSRRSGRIFRDWGIPTAYSMAMLRRTFPDRELIATGGIRSGLDVAKALALGANAVGVGLPLLRAALENPDTGPIEWLKALLDELKIAMLASGCRRPEDLKHRVCHGMPYQDVFNMALQDKSYDER